MNALPKAPPLASDPRSPGHGRKLTIGLLNNAPDHAFRTTERRFTRALQEAAPHDEVRVQSYALPEISRHFVANHAYLPIERLFAAPPDALIVSGAEPTSPDLRHEPYWQSLTQVIDWAMARRLPTILSCLAAHAAAGHLAGIQRQKLAVKCSGVFAVRRRLAHRLLGDLPEPLYAPHSRWNALPEGALVAAGYRILTSSAEAGVDMFIDPTNDSVLYLNGHPEYEADTLMREYCRDVARFLRQQQPIYPDLPRMAIEGEHRALVDTLRALAEAGRNDAALGLLRGLDAALPASRPWQTLAACVFGNWLDHVHQYAT